MCVHPFWQDEKRILLHMNDALGGGVIAAESCTPALLSATLQKLNRLGAHEQRPAGGRAHKAEQRHFGPTTERRHCFAVTR